MAGGPGLLAAELARRPAMAAHPMMGHPSSHGQGIAFGGGAGAGPRGLARRSSQRCMGHWSWRYRCSPHASRCSDADTNVHAHGHAHGCCWAVHALLSHPAFCGADAGCTFHRGGRQLPEYDSAVRSGILSLLDRRDFALKRCDSGVLHRLLSWSRSSWRIEPLNCSLRSSGAVVGYRWNCDAASCPLRLRLLRFRRRHTQRA